VFIRVLLGFADSGSRPIRDGCRLSRAESLGLDSTQPPFVQRCLFMAGTFTIGFTLQLCLIKKSILIKLE